MTVKDLREKLEGMPDGTPIALRENSGTFAGCEMEIEELYDTTKLHPRDYVGVDDYTANLRSDVKNREKKISVLVIQ